MNEKLVCQNCGNDEFAGRSAAWDIFRIVDERLGLIRTEADDFPPDELFCNRCWEAAKLPVAESAGVNDA